MSLDEPLLTIYIHISILSWHNFKLPSNLRLTQQAKLTHLRKPSFGVAANFIQNEARHLEISILGILKLEPKILALINPNSQLGKFWSFS